MVSAMCPNCHILLVEANTNNDSDLAAAENIAAAWPGVHAISNSYGDAEYPGSTALEPSYNHPSIAITVSTGDGGYGAQFPAVSPHVTAIGGTSLKRASNARGWSETAWSKAGSGCSSIYPQPSWQTAVSPLCAFRMVADTSAVADPNTGVAAYGPLGFFNLSGWLVVGGTSVGAPLTAAIYGLNGTTPAPQNQNQVPYLNTGSLNDVTSGSNGSCGGTYFCTAGTGYDGPTGLGTPKGDVAF
jgi:subtilase family serine protease